MFDVKTCTSCGQERSVDQFYKQSGSTRLRGECKACNHERAAQWRGANRERFNELARQRRNTRWERLNHVRKKFGLTAEQYEAMEIAQGYACAVTSCRRPFAELNRQPHVDHCHVTGKVRGLLCHQCNQALGNARDDVGILQGLINYLEAAR